VTFVIIDGLVITVASVGDSRCVLEAEGSIYHLSSDHRFDASKEEVDRVTESGGDVGRLNVVGGAEIGPLRCWPGGLCLSRSIGDQDVGQFIVPVPLVKQVKVYPVQFFTSASQEIYLICFDFYVFSFLL
jgi:serine/threonine protein phosphatase PrpC